MIEGIRQWWDERWFKEGPMVTSDHVPPVAPQPTGPAWDYGYAAPQPGLSGMVDGTPTSRKMMVETLSVAQSALTSHPDSRRTEHIGRLQWLIDAIEHDEGDVSWYSAGVRDGRAENPDAARLPDAGVDPDTHARIFAEGTAHALAHARVDLTPFEEVLTELDIRKRAFGGGVQAAYANASDMVRSALRRYDHPEDPPRH